MITPAQKAAYAADGCVQIEKAFDSSWVDLLTQAFDRHLALIRSGQKPSDIKRGAIAPADGDYNDDAGNSHLRNATVNDENLWRWASQSPAAHIVGALTGAKTVQYWYDIWFCKDHGAQASNGATPWHHDASGHPFSGAHMPSLWVALTDVSEEDSPLVTYRGSHTDKRYFRPPYTPGKEGVETPANYGTNDEMLATVDAHPENVQVWTCKAGDALLLHPLTWHASKPQRASGRRRLAFTTRWIGSDLVWDPKPFSFNGYFEGAKSLAPGDTAPVDFLPVLWTSQAGASENP